MRVEHGLDLGRIDVHAAGDDQVLAAAVEPDHAVVVHPAQVADGHQVPAPRGRRLLRRPPVLEAGPARHRAPQLAALVGLQPPPRAGAAHAAGVGQPVVRRADGELGLGGAVELPHAAVGQRLEHRPLQRLGARARRRAPGGGTRTSRSPCAISRCRWVGTQNVVVGRSPSIAAAARAVSKGPGQQHLAAGEQGVDGEAQRRAVVQRGEHQVPVGRARSPRARSPRRPAAGRRPRPGRRTTRPCAVPSCPDV